MGSLYEGIPIIVVLARVCTLSRETGRLGRPHVLAGAESDGAKVIRQMLGAFRSALVQLP